MPLQLLSERLQRTTRYCFLFFFQKDYVGWFPFVLVWRRWLSYTPGIAAVFVIHFYFQIIVFIFCVEKLDLHSSFAKHLECYWYIVLVAMITPVKCYTCPKSRRLFGCEAPAGCAAREAQRQQSLNDNLRCVSVLYMFANLGIIYSLWLWSFKFGHGDNNHVPWLIWAWR